MQMKKLFILLMAPLIMMGAGCSSTTNLTASQATRNATGLYPVEFKWNTQRKAVKPDSVKAVVIVGDQSYPMDPVPLVKDRWQGNIPVAPGAQVVEFHFRVDYLVDSFGKPNAKTYVSPSHIINFKDSK